MAYNIPTDVTPALATGIARLMDAAYAAANRAGGVGAKVAARCGRLGVEVVGTLTVDHGGNVIVVQPDGRRFLVPEERWHEMQAAS